MTVYMFEFVITSFHFHEPILEIETGQIMMTLYVLITCNLRKIDGMFFLHLKCTQFDPCKLLSTVRQRIFLHIRHKLITN